MRKAFLLLLLIMLSQLLIATEINVVSYNIRYANPNDGEFEWSKRKDSLFAQIRSMDADIICLQEVLFHQYQDVKAAFPKYNSVGLGREDGKNKGEFLPILFDSTKFSLKSFEWKWLSETSDSVSVGWDAACHRMLCWVTLIDQSGKEFVVANTHIDHMGAKAMANSMLLIDSVRQYNWKNSFVVLCGDFNMSPKKKPIKGLLKTTFNDSKKLAKKRSGVRYTFAGFNRKCIDNVRIDYIFLSGDCQVLTYEVKEKRFSSAFLSDHLPVFTRIIIN